MIGSVIEQQAAIVAIFHTRRELHYLEPSPTEWRILEDLHRLLEPFKDSTEILSGHYYPTLSCLGPILAKLKEKLAHKIDDSVAIKSVKGAISDDLNGRYQEPSLVALMNTASFLDPWFKSLAHLNRESIDAIIKHVEDEVGELMQLSINTSAGTAESAQSSDNDCEVVDVEDSSVTVAPPRKKQRKIHPLKKMLGEKFGSTDSEVTSTMCIHEQACAEVAKYRAEPQIELDHKPFEWWKEHKSIYPTLCKLAHNTLCIVATSVPSECLFIISGNVISQKRSCLSPRYAERLIFLHENLDPLHQNYKRKSRNCKCERCNS